MTITINRIHICITILLCFLLIPQTLTAQTEKDITAINEIGLLYYNSGNYSEAINEFKKILRIKPDHDVAHFNLGCVYEKMKQYEASMNEFQEVLNVIPDDGEAKSKIQKMARQWASNIKIDLETNPADPELRCNMGICHLYLGELNEAYENLSAALKVKPDYAKANYQLSQYYLKKGSYKQALKPAKKAAKQKPRNALYKKNYRKIAQFLGVKTNSVETKGPVKTNNNEEELFKRGKKYYDSGNYDTASKYFSKVVKINPENSLAKEYLKKIKENRKNESGLQDAYYEGEKYYKSEQWDRAIDYFNKIIKLDKNKSFPSYADTLKMLAESYMRIGKLHRAEEYLNELLRENPNDWKVLYLLGYVYHKKGDQASSEKYFTKAKRTTDIPDKYVAMINDILKSYDWESKSIYVYSGVGALLLIIIGGVVFYNLPSSKKKRFIAKITEHQSKNDFEGIIKDCEKLNKITLSRPEFLRIYNILATAYLATDNPDKAIMTAKRVVMKDSQNKMGHEILGKSYFKKKLVTTEALLEYKRLLANDGSNMEILKLIGTHYVKTNKEGKLSKTDTISDSLLDNFKDYLIKDSSDRELVLYIGNMLRKRKDTSPKASKIYELALHEDPENYRIREVLSKSYFEQKKYNEAIEECKEVFKENIGSTQTHRIFIDSNMKLDRYDDVILEYEKLTLLYPENQDIERRLVELKKQNISIEGGGKRQGPVEIDYGSCLKKGLSFLSVGDFNKAISELRVAKKDKQYAQQASMYLVKCYIKKELIDLAREEFGTMRTTPEFLSGELINITYDLAKVLEDKGQFKDALKLYDKICKVDIGYKDVFDKFEELHDYVSRF